MKSSVQKWLVAVVILLPVLLGIIILLSSGSTGLKGGISFKKVAVVRLEGVITDADWYVQVLREHRLDRSISGVLLRIDSPGGAVAPSQEIYKEVAAYKAAGKPLVVSMGNIAASGGYYIASPAQRIFASPGTLTGSIGVIFTLPLYQELTKKLGVEFRIFKAGAFKDMGSPYRNMEQQESALLQTLLDDTHEQFITDVSKGREMDIDSIRPIADGRIFTGKQAYELNMIDSLGGFEDALAYLYQKTGVTEGSKVVEKKQHSESLWDLFSESARSKFPALGSLSKPAGLYYLFQP